MLNPTPHASRDGEAEMGARPQTPQFAEHALQVPMARLREPRDCARACLLRPTSSSFIVLEVSVGGGIYLRENCLLTPRTTANYCRVDKVARAIWDANRSHEATVFST